MGIAFKERLFKVHSSGKVGDWTITVTDNNDGTATMVRAATKVLGGKPVETPTNYTQGKNIGRANETTPLEQAISEAKSRYQKQLDKGYVIEQPEEGAKVTNSLGFIKPMLAQPIEKVNGWDYPVYASPKLDGHRLLATVKDGEVVLYSRAGKLVDCEHIREELQKTYEAAPSLWRGLTLDGEIYCHGETLQKISSLVKKPQEESKRLKYHLYDAILSNQNDGDNYYQRLHLITRIANFCETSIADVTPTFNLHSEDELNKFHAENLSAGYEGTMVRWGNFSYEDGKRSKSLLKKKDFQDAEFKILSVKQGKPKILPDGTQLELAIYVCECNGEEFEATAPGTMYEKHDAWVNREQAVGKPLTVKFFNYTPSGVPFLPVALQIREDL